MRMRWSDCTVRFEGIFTFHLENNHQVPTGTGSLVSLTVQLFVSGNLTTLEINSPNISDSLQPE